MAKKTKSALDFVTSMNKRAEKLADVRVEIRRREEEWKANTDALFAEEKKLKEELLGDLNTIGLKSVTVSSGDSYYISKTHDFHFRNPLEEDKWARENRCVRVDRVAMKQHLNLAFRKGNLPETVEVSERETISVRKSSTEVDQGSS